jgi:hypothetical protein
MNPQLIKDRFNYFKSMKARNEHFIVGSQNKHADIDTGDTGIIDISIIGNDTIIVKWKGISTFSWEETQTAADHIAQEIIGDAFWSLNSKWDADFEGWYHSSEESFESRYKGDDPHEACNVIWKEFQNYSQIYQEWHEETKEALDKLYDEVQHGKYEEDEIEHLDEEEVY